MWAAASYLLVVAPFVLLSKRTREVRLVRFHAVQALGVLGLLLIGIMAGNVLSALFASIPLLGFWSNLLVGFGFVLLFLVVAFLLLHGALAAYQGTYTRIPVLTNWTWQMLGAPGGDRRNPRRRRREKDEERSPESTP